MSITIGFGIPGVGKSTLFARVAQMNKRKKIKYYKRIEKSFLYRKLSEKSDAGSKIATILFNLLYAKNFFDVVYCSDPSIQDTVPFRYEDLGKFKPTYNSLFLMEEAGIGLDNRRSRELPKESKRFAAMHRHNGADIFMISQTVDIDKAYRSRAEVMHIVKKVGGFTVFRRITYSIGVDDQTNQLVEKYGLVKPLSFISEIISSMSKRSKNAKMPWLKSFAFRRKPWYPYFDSFVDDYNYPMVAPDIQMQLDAEEARRKEEAEKLAKRAKIRLSENYVAELSKMS